MREQLVVSTLIKEVVEQILKDYKKKYGKTIDLKDALLSSFESSSKSDELSIKINEKADNIKGFDVNKFSRPLIIESYYDKIAYELLQEEPFTIKKRNDS